MWHKFRKNKQNIAGGTNIIRSDKKSPSRIKSTLLLVLMFVSLVAALPIFQSNTASAASKYDGFSFLDQIESHQYVHTITYCMGNSWLSTSSGDLPWWGIFLNPIVGIFNASATDTISPEDATAGIWFGTKPGGPTKTKANLGAYMTDIADGVANYGEINCADLSIKAILDKWGLDPIDVLCNSGFHRIGQSSNDNAAECSANTISNVNSNQNAFFERESDQETLKKFYAYIVTNVYDGEQPKMTNAQQYIFYRHTLNETCITNIDNTEPDKTAVDEANKSAYNNVRWVNKEDSPEILQGPDPYLESSYIGAEERGKDIKLRVGRDTPTNLTNEQKNCNWIKIEMNKFAGDYQIWARDNPAKAAEVNKYFKDLQDNNGGKSATNCTIDYVGWIVCPVIHFMADIADASYQFLANNFLEVKPELFDTKNATYEAWSIMRNFANIAFVIAFLIIIYSQLTGIGITNYGVKKLLPKIIIAAILVNLSYFICQIGVDLSNIIGKSFSELFTNLGGSPPSGARETGFWGGTNNWGNVAGEVLAMAVVGGVLYAALGALIPILILAVFALVMILFILTARQALLVLLVVISPLAFVAYLLPNTEKWYKNWQKMFVGLLLLYPIVGLVYGVSGFASRILGSNDVMGKNVLGQIAAASVLILPLFLIPVILKKSLDGVGNLGQTLNNMGKKGGKFTSDKLMGSDISKHLQAKSAEKKARVKTGNYRAKFGNKNPMNWRSSLNRRMNRNAGFNAVTGGYGAARTLEGQAQDRKAEADAIAMIRNDDNLAQAMGEDGGEHGDAYDKLTRDQKEQYDLIRASGQHKKGAFHLAVAAHMHQSGKGSIEQIQQAYDHAAANGSTESDIRNAKSLGISASRKSGRSDIAAELTHEYVEYYNKEARDWNAANAVDIASGAKTKIDTKPSMPLSARYLEEAAKVTPSATHREIFEGSRPGTTFSMGTESTYTDKRLAYRRNLQNSAEHTRAALAGYDSMEQRAKDKGATAEIINAANNHSVAAGGTIITSIQEAKKYFGVQ